MTPTGIKTGRQFDSTTRSVALPELAVTLLASGDGNRVGLVVALAATSVVLLGQSGIAIGPTIAGAVVPLTTLSAGHPVCYLSVDKIGPMLFPALSAYQESGNALVLGVTIIRQVQELP